MNFKLILVVIPILFGLITSFICPVSRESGRVVKITPPNYVFGIVWPILYFLIGISWYFITSENNIYLHIPYIVLLLLLFFWIIAYSCYGNKLNGVYVLFFTLLTIIITMIVGNMYSRLFLSPLLVWIILAIFMNVLEVESK